MTEEEWLTALEAARRAGLKASETVRRWGRNGRVPRREVPWGKRTTYKYPAEAVCREAGVDRQHASPGDDVGTGDDPTQLRDRLSVLEEVIRRYGLIDECRDEIDSHRDEVDRQRREIDKQRREIEALLRAPSEVPNN